MKYGNKIDKGNLIVRTLIAFFMVAALGLTALPTFAADAKDDAQKALDKLIEKIEAVNKAKDALKQAQDAVVTAMSVDKQDGPGTSSEMAKTLEVLRAAVAKAEAALKEAEAEAYAALLALDEAIKKVPKDKDREELRRKRGVEIDKWTKPVDQQNVQFALGDSLEGVVTIEMKTDNGQQVNLTIPADIRAGDTISGSVNEQDSATFSGAVFDIGGKEYRLRDRILTFVVPAAAGAALPVILKNSAGYEIGRKQIPINKNAGLSGNIPTQLGNVVPPRIGQTGQIVSIPTTGKIGKYDGIAGDTRVAFTPNTPQATPTNIPVIAKSPRGTFVKVPSNAQTGAGALSIEDAGVRAQFPFNVLNISLRADMLSIPRGKTTTLHAEITGMKGLVEDKCDIMLNLKNLSPSVVRFKSSSSDNITTKVTPNSQGTAMFNYTLTGINAGAFTIRAWLLSATSLSTGGLKRINDLLHDIGVLQKMKDDLGIVSDPWGGKRKSLQDQIDRKFKEIDEILHPKP